MNQWHSSKASYLKYMYCTILYKLLEYQAYSSIVPQVVSLSISCPSKPCAPSLRTLLSKIVWNFNLSTLRMALFFHPWMDETSKALPNMQHFLSTYMVEFYPQCKHVQFLPLGKLPNHENFLYIQIHNSKTCNMVQKFHAKSLNEMISYNNNLLRRIWSENKNMWSI